MFTSRICRNGYAAEKGKKGSNVDYLAAFLFGHVPGGKLGKSEGRGKIHFEYSIPFSNGMIQSLFAKDRTSIINTELLTSRNLNSLLF